MDCKKKKYNNKNIARKQAEYYFKITGVKSKPYGCEICKKVHLTTKCSQK